MIIDAHVHMYPPEIKRNWQKIAEREPYFAALVQSRAHRWGAREDLLQAMEEDGVDTSWVCGFGFTDMGLCREVNNYVLEAAEKNPGKICPMIVVPPLHPETEAEIARCASRGAIGVGELFPGGQRWDIDDVRQTWRLAGICHEASLFLLIHTAEPVGHDYPGKGATGPREAAAFCMHHPEVSVIFAHWGGGLWLYEAMPEMKRYLQNAWYDMAASPFLYGKEIFRALSGMPWVMDRVLYGSDYPLLRLPRYKNLVQEAFPQAFPEHVPGLFGGNARALLQKLRRE
ncbi:MAG TPA: amidohydrolase family protein [Synergistaceae bacterium]|nr:amidohydrolase family protein [Synergistaceae bacterium]HPJ26634.1 amidohydrolase family protein [Synergistaceae bacterium]HPQ37488.1 amidohydrolase family protein [Synergistaceae bacterium]